MWPTPVTTELKRLREKVQGQPELYKKTLALKIGRQMGWG